MLVDAAQIAAVIGLGLTAVIDARGAGGLVVCWPIAGWPIICWPIVGWIAVGEAIGHDQVDDVVAIETFEVAAGVGTGQQRQRYRRRSRRSGEPQGHGSGAQLGTQAQVDEEIMSVGGCFGAADGHSLGWAFHASAAQVLTGEQERELGRVVRPPVRGIDLADYRTGGNYIACRSWRSGHRP